MNERIPLSQLVQYYGCVRCQRQHFEDTEPQLFDDHRGWQSKHGISLFHETMSERAARYGIARPGNEGLLAAYQKAAEQEQSRRLRTIPE